MNPVSNAIREIENVIPSQILTAVFGHEDYRNWRRQAPASIDEMIRSKVIRPRVLKDCNLVGGRLVYVSTEGLEGYSEDPFSVMYTIPPQKTGNREIISVMGVNYLPHSSAMGTMGTPYGSVNPVTQSDVETVGQRVMDSYANVPHISSAHAELVGYNTVIIRDQMRSTVIYELRCVLANEENLSNISPRSYPILAKACILAVKSYIYNNLIIRIDQGVLEQGQALGEFKTIVDKYDDAEEQYQNYLETKVKKTLFMNDIESYDRFINIQINPGL